MHWCPCWSQDTEGLATTPITVVTYGMFQKRASVVAQHITDAKFRVVVLDESHYIKVRVDDV